jgi:hypothetical protein
MSGHSFAPIGGVSVTYTALCDRMGTGAPFSSGFGNSVKRSFTRQLKEHRDGSILLRTTETR